MYKLQLIIIICSWPQKITIKTKTLKKQSKKHAIIIIVIFFIKFHSEVAHYVLNNEYIHGCSFSAVNFWLLFSFVCHSQMPITTC
jgi:hypothetical protein